MLAPDGTLLCTCDKKKIQWYLERDIAGKFSKFIYNLFRIGG